MKVLKFKDGEDIIVVPESEVESVGSYSPNGATLTLKSGQEVLVDRNAGVDAIDVKSIEQMVRIVMKDKQVNGIQSRKSKPEFARGNRTLPQVQA